jgi:signal transduction histidine kinase
MQIMVNKLIDNAVKYSPPDSPITIHLKRRPGILDSRDEGTGIPEKNRKDFSKILPCGK